MSKILEGNLPNIPWQEKPANFNGPIWRHTENPIIGRNPVEGVARIFNSAVMPYGDEFIGVFRGETINGRPHIYLGHSKDAIHWEFDKERINFVDEDGNQLFSDKQLSMRGDYSTKGNKHGYFTDYNDVINNINSKIDSNAWEIKQVNDTETTSAYKYRSTTYLYSEKKPGQ